MSADNWRLTQLGRLYSISDDRAGSIASRLPLMSVSQYVGVVPRSELVGDSGRAESLAGYKLCESGDLVINRMSAYNGALGVARQRGLVSPDYLVIRPRADVCADFLALWLRTPLGVGEMTRRLRGIGGPETAQVRTPRVGHRELRSILLLLPNIHDQVKIVERLKVVTERIDELIAKQQQLIAALRERRAAAVADALVRAGGEPTKLKRLARIQTGLTLSGDGDPKLPEWPYLRVANVQAGFVDTGTVKTVRASYADAIASTLRTGDVLMTEGGDIDKLGRGSLWDGRIDPCLHQNHVFAVRPHPDLDPKYLIYLLDGERARTYFRLTAKKTTNLASTNKWTVGNLPIVVPPPAEQRAVVCGLDERTAMIDVLIGKAEQFIELARERRAALITGAVTGQIDVRDVA